MRKVLFSALILTVMLVSCCQNANNQAVAEQKNETMESIMNRRSIRAYKQDAVPQNVLDTLKLAAINAPSARNLQPWEMRIVKNREIIAEIESGVLAMRKAEKPDMEFKPVFFGAPVLLVVAYDKSNSFGQLDCGWFGQNILLAAYSLGLGTCVIANANGFYNSENGKNVMSKLNFSENYEVAYSIALGYPAEEPAAKPRDAEKVQFIE